MRQHNHTRPSWTGLVLTEGATKERLCSKYLKEPPGDWQDADAFGPPRTRQVHALLVKHRCQLGKASRLLSPVPEVLEGSGGARSPVHHARDRDKAFGFWEWKGLQQQGVENAEHCGRSADSDGENGDDKEGESRSAAKPADRQSNLARKHSPISGGTEMATTKQLI
jgi:hypothetical protein